MDRCMPRRRDERNRQPATLPALYPLLLYFMNMTGSTATTMSSSTFPFQNVEPEFVAVVLAATVGARLFPLAQQQQHPQPHEEGGSGSTSSSGSRPKHLLPIAGVPLLERLLREALHDVSHIFVALAAEDTTTVPALLESSADWEEWTNENGLAAVMNRSNDNNHNRNTVTDPTTSSNSATTTTTTAPTGTRSSFTAPVHSVWKSKTSSSHTTTTNTSQYITVVHMPEDCPGSAEVLRQLEGLLPRTAHTMIVPGDLVVTQPTATLAALVQAHRHGQGRPRSFYDGSSSNDDMSSPPPAACTVLLHDVGEQDETTGVPMKESAKAKKGGLAREPEEIEYMALAMPSKTTPTTAMSSSTMSPRLIWKIGKLQAEQDEDFTLTGQTPKLNIPKARLRTTGSASVVKVRNDWNDLHVYVLSPWVVRLVQAKTSILHLQRDLLPLLIRRQFVGKVETFGQGVEPHRVLEILEELEDENNNSVWGNMMSPKDAHGNGNNNNNNNITTPAAHTAKLMKPHQTYSVLAHVVKTGAMRSSSLPAYLYASKEMLQTLVANPAMRRNEPRLTLPANSTTNAKFVSLLLPDAQIGDKPTLKASIVGRGCRLGNKCRLNNVILMDGVQLGDNVVLQNTIVGPAATIGDNCSLNDCQVAAGMQVASGTKEKGEVLVETLTMG